MNNEKHQRAEDGLFPVFKFSLDNSIVFANGPARSLMNFWNCKLNEKIPSEVISTYPELFHCALSHKPMDITVDMDNYSIRFSIVPFPEAGYIGMYAYCMEQHKHYTGKSNPVQQTVHATN